MVEQIVKDIVSAIKEAGFGDMKRFLDKSAKGRSVSIGESHIPERYEAVAEILHRIGYETKLIVKRFPEHDIVNCSKLFVRNKE